jgi:hypothetical protein
MSDVTNPSPGRHFDRRAVVKGAAWSVPVIAAAVAAPAAAASAATALVAFSANTAPKGLTWTRLNGNQNATVKGTGPTSFSIQNSPGAITGPITGIITVRPTNTGTSKPYAIGVKTVAGSTGLTNVTTTTTTPNTADTITATFTLAAGVASSAFISVNLTFGYQLNGNTVPTSQTTLLTYQATLQLTDSRSVQIGQLATQVLSTNFSAT